VPEPAQLDAVTFDANGTLLRLVDPVPVLRDLLRRHGVELSTAEMAAAFADEARYYGDHCVSGRDDESLAALRRECLGVLLGSAGAHLDPELLFEGYVDAFSFEILPGVSGVLRQLRARGLALAVVSNWDLSMHARLEELGLAGLVDAAVASSDAGASKPDRAIFDHALGLLGVSPDRALHVGDSPADEDGAAAAGMHFAPVPVTTAFAAWR
jgi:HAD superfamily hydrolase (TIGR01509 family)